MPPTDELQLYVDGGARGNPGPAAAGWVILSHDGRVVASDSLYLGHATNNEAEYTAMLKGLAAAKELGATELGVFSDSELVVKQLTGEYRVRKAELRELFDRVQRALLAFDRWHIRHITRRENRRADALVNRELDRALGDDLSDERETGLDTEFSSPVASTESARILVDVSVGEVERCPIGLREGQCFVFSKVVPAGLCLRAMQAVLPTVLTMQTGSSVDNEAAQTVRCSGPGCAASFNIHIIR